MATTQFEIEARHNSEDEHVVRWRFDELRRAGYNISAAMQLAERRDVDLHLAVRLLLAGCPQTTALRILV